MRELLLLIAAARHICLIASCCQILQIFTNIFNQLLTVNFIYNKLSENHENFPAIIQ
jgi:hypothetical protein